MLVPTRWFAFVVSVYACEPTGGFTHRDDDGPCMADQPSADEDEPDSEQELEFESALAREEIAAHLEAFAGSLRGDGAFELTIGGKTASVDPPGHLEFEVELEDELEEDGVERSIEFELEWRRQDHETPLEE